MVKKDQGEFPQITIYKDQITISFREKESKEDEKNKKKRCFSMLFSLLITFDLHF